jgi:hypothetical protein
MLDAASHLLSFAVISCFGQIEGYSADRIYRRPPGRERLERGTLEQHS